MTGETGLPEIERLYLLTIAGALESRKYACVLQQMGENQGRLWIMEEGTTKPAGCLQFKFEENRVLFELQVRDEGQKSQSVIDYAEGIDELPKQILRALQARMLADKRAA